MREFVTAANILRRERHVEDDVATLLPPPVLHTIATRMRSASSERRPSLRRRTGTVRLAGLASVGCHHSLERSPVVFTQGADLCRNPDLRCRGMHPHGFTTEIAVSVRAHGHRSPGCSPAHAAFIGDFSREVRA